jgi:hypothetical protein
VINADFNFKKLSDFQEVWRNKGINNREILSVAIGRSRSVKGIGVGPSTSADASIEGDPSVPVATSAIKSKSGRAIGVGSSTSADASIEGDPSVPVATSAIKSKLLTVAEVSHAADKKNKKILEKSHDEIDNFFQYALPENIVTTGANGTLKINIDTFEHFKYTQDKPPMQSTEKMIKYTKNLRQMLQKRPSFDSHPHAAHYLSSIDRVSYNCCRLLNTNNSMIDFIVFCFSIRISIL